MVDSLSSERRSWNMSRVKNRNTKPEILVRSLLHRKGYRFRIHSKKLPGKPDIVLPKYKSVIFVNGCFWHRHENCSDATVPKTRTEFWLNKFEQTVNRDKKNREQLAALGWNVFTIWECEMVHIDLIIGLIRGELAYAIGDYVSHEEVKLRLSRWLDPQ
jgi:DNA mismatch endonuclease, patch repair protein